MDTVPCGVKRAKASRCCTLEGGTLTVRVGGAYSFYLLRPLASDYGLAFELRKVGDPDDPDTIYHVNIDPQTGRHECGCLGMLRWNHCRHTESLLALFAAGKLPGVPAVVTPAPARMPQTRYSVEERRNEVNVPADDADASEYAMRRPAGRKVAALGNAG